jgi:HKD family nuclease
VFIAQPEYSLGNRINEEFVAQHRGRRRWDIAEFAVAWVNNSGINKIFHEMKGFLVGGGRIHVTVGLDFGSTTLEGLERLLELEQSGDMTTHVFYDENPACTFHPKIFIFRSNEEAHLVVGSNNMTGAGLDTNIEAALSFTSDLGNGTIRSALDMLEAWRNEESDTRTRRLTTGLLTQLRARGYVLKEEEMRARRRSDDNHRTSADLPLFGRSSARPHRPGHSNARQRTNVGRTTGSALGEVLLMRIRPRRNGNQVQISMKILEASFMHGAEEVVSVNGFSRKIGYNMARGVRNTARFEAPEMRDMSDPVARFQWANVPGGERGHTVLQYEIFDAKNDTQGYAILTKLKEGKTSPPLTKLEELSQGETVLSISDESSAQWYRLDSA